MRLRARPRRTVSIQVVEREYDASSRKTRIVRDTSHTLTLHDTTADEIWSLVTPIILAHAEDRQQWDDLSAL